MTKNIGFLLTLLLVCDIMQVQGSRLRSHRRRQSHNIQVGGNRNQENIPEEENEMNMNMQAEIKNNKRKGKYNKNYRNKGMMIQNRPMVTGRPPIHPKSPASHLRKNILSQTNASLRSSSLYVPSLNKPRQRPHRAQKNSRRYKSRNH